MHRLSAHGMLATTVIFVLEFSRTPEFSHVLMIPLRDSPSSSPGMTIRPKLAVEKSQLQELLLLDLFFMQFQLVDVP